jgi:hypothetical protein
MTIGTRPGAPQRIMVSQAISPISERETAVLRALGRLGVLHLPVLHALIFADAALRSVQRYTNRLIERGLVWRQSGPGTQISLRGGGTRPVRTPAVYGLTLDGKAYLDALQMEPQGGVFERLIARDRRAPPPSESALVADLLISSWCASVIDEVRRTTMLVGVTCQARPTIVTGELRQTIAAVLTLIFDPQQHAYTRPGWQIPWFDGETVKDRYRVIRLALEIDTGRAASAALIDQAQLYAHFTQGGVYTAVFGGALRPVILVPPGDRGTTVATMWAKAWPQTSAIISSTTRVHHPQHGALWGTYFTVKDAPAQQAALLGGMVPSIAQWAQLTAGWTPGLPL